MKNSGLKRKSDERLKCPVPAWAGRYPFPPEEKRAVVLKREDSLPRVYGRDPHRIGTYLNLSTDRLTSTEFAIQPGEYIDPPDIHSGDEIYFALKGTITVLNPDTGEAHTLKEGEALFIPKGTWHQSFNFTDTPVRAICFFAPSIWSNDERGISIEYPGQPAYYKGGDGKSEE